MAPSSYEVPGEPHRDGVETIDQGRPETAPSRPRLILPVPFRKPLLCGVCLGLLGALAAWLLAQAPPLCGLEDWASDAFFVWRGPRSSQARIVVVGIDDESLRQLHKPAPYLSPELAEVVRHAHAQGAAAIGIDLLIGSDLSSVPDIERRGGPGDARPMGQADVDAGNVVLAQWRVEDHWERPLWPWQRKALDPETAGPTDFAFVNCTEDGDQVVRRQQLLVRDGDAAVPQFARALFARARGADIQWDDPHGTLFVWLRPGWGAVVAVGLPLLWLGLGLLLLKCADWGLEVVPLVLLGLLTYAAAAALRRWLTPVPTVASTAGALPPTGLYVPTALRPPAELAAQTESRSPSAPSDIAGYEILGEVGHGGMGVVYKARQFALKRIVALMMLRAGADAGPDLLARFRAESEAVARMQHPNIVQVYDYGEWRAGDVSPPMPFFVLEFMDGGSLAGKLRGQPFALARAVDLMVTLARAVQHAHQRGVIHRDLKPANVLFTADGLPKIADFGLAKLLDEASDLTRIGAVLGTPSYMAPEQAAGHSAVVGRATDVYALGAILYELLAGRPPFRADTSVATLDQVRFQAPVPPSQFRPGVPPKLEAICLQCLEKDPARRYPTAEALARALLEAHPC
jgi:hypothetical protein